ncbi:MAG: ribonuclease R [Candidatus Aminicenantales bacterium]
MEKKIMPLLKKHPEGMSLQDIVGELRVPRKNKNKLLETLKALEKEGALRHAGTLFKIASRSNVVRGRLVTVLRGFGFVTPEGGATEDIFIPARDSASALLGDTVEVMVREKGKKGKPEGKILRILKKGRLRILGVYSDRGGTPRIAAFDSMSPEDLAVRVPAKFRPMPGMIVEADRTSLELAAVLGFPDDPGVDTQVIIRQHNLAAEFPAGVAAEAERISSVSPLEALSGRTDYRDWQTITVDGEKAQDFDDAVSIRLLPNGHYLLGVHIADVSHYVQPGSELDDEAFARATSVYFPDLTLPMLPESLSNGLCSLRPRVPRLTVSVIIEIDGGGKVVHSEFHPSVIQTVERMTYTSVFKIFEGDRGECERYNAILPALTLMRSLARLLKAKRVEAGSLDFDLLEPELVYTGGNLTSIVPAERNEAHQLVEEFMVAANVAVAAWIGRSGVPSIYRIHPAPAEADLDKLKEILTHFGLLLPKADRIGSRDLQAVLERMKGQQGEKFVNFQVLRSLKLATYSDANLGHYGLAKTDYTHFTSPIRRYPDLIVHRVLKKILAGGRDEKAPVAVWALHCSQKERQANESERDLMLWRIFRFLKMKLGEDFSGIITDVTKAGLVVELDHYFADGILPFQSIDGDYYYRRDAKTLRGRKKGRTFELGEQVRVVLVSCDPAQRRMEFALSPEMGGKP